MDLILKDKFTIFHVCQTNCAHRIETSFDSCSFRLLKKYSFNASNERRCFTAEPSLASDKL